MYCVESLTNTKTPTRNTLFTTTVLTVTIFISSKPR